MSAKKNYKLFGNNESMQIGHGNSMDVLSEIDTNSIDCIVTDPPYHLTYSEGYKGKGVFGRLQQTYLERDKAMAGKTINLHSTKVKSFMNETWDGGEIAFNVALGKKCWRVLKPGGFLIAFNSTRTYHRLATAIEKAGFYIKDQLAYIYATGFPKGLDIAKSIDKKTGNLVEPEFYKDAHCYNEKTGGPSSAAAEWQNYNTALNPAGEPIVLAQKPLEGSYKDNILKGRVGAFNISETTIPYEADEITNVASKLNSDLAHQQNPHGRRPKNIILDASPELKTLFPIANGKSVTRFFYGVKASTIDREEGLAALQAHIIPNQRTRKNNHPTVKPTELMQYLIKLVAPPGAIILDLFMGSGSTGKAAAIENQLHNKNYKFIGVEIMDKYLEIAKHRILHGPSAFINRTTHKHKKVHGHQMTLFEN